MCSPVPCCNSVRRWQVRTKEVWQVAWPMLRSVFAKLKRPKMMVRQAGMCSTMGTTTRTLATSQHSPTWAARNTQFQRPTCRPRPCRRCRPSMARFLCRRAWVKEWSPNGRSYVGLMEDAKKSSEICTYLKWIKKTFGTGGTGIIKKKITPAVDLALYLERMGWMEEEPDAPFVREFVDWKVHGAIQRLSLWMQSKLLTSIEGVWKPLSCKHVWNDGNNMEGHSHVPFILRWFLVRSTASTDCTFGSTIRALEPDLRRSVLLRAPVEETVALSRVDPFRDFINIYIYIDSYIYIYYMIYTYSPYMFPIYVLNHYKSHGFLTMSLAAPLGLGQPVLRWRPDGAAAYVAGRGGAAPSGETVLRVGRCGPLEGTFLSMILLWYYYMG